MNKKILLFAVACTATTVVPAYGKSIKDLLKDQSFNIKERITKNGQGYFTVNLTGLELTSLKGMSDLVRRLGNNALLVKNLFLTSNQLKKIEDGAFCEFKNLDVIDLSQNNLKDVSSSTFKGLKKMTILSLSRNHIQKDRQWEIQKAIRKVAPDVMVLL